MINSHYLLAVEPWLVAVIAVVAVAAVCAIVASFVTAKKKKDKAAAQPTAEPELVSEPEPVAEEPAHEEEPVVEPEPEIVEEPEPVLESNEEPVEVAESAPVEEPAAEPGVEPEPEPEPVAEEPVAEEPAHEEEPAPVAEPAADDEKDEKEEQDEKAETEEEEYEAPVRKVQRVGEHIRYIIIKYNKSFTAKLIQSADGVKDYYTHIKNELLSYKGVKSRISWKYEAFNAGRKMLAKLSVRGKHLNLFLALDPKKYADSKYIVDDMSDVAAYEKTQLKYCIKNDRRLHYSAELIAEVMQESGLERLAEPVAEEWGKAYPYEEIEPLVERKLVKELTEEDAQSGDVFKPRGEVSASEVNELLQDEIAVALIEETEEVSDRSKSAIINIDTLSKNFEDGETVTLEEIKNRIPEIPKKTTYIKVLARGTLDKKLKVIADSFSIEAAKMILLTGGNAVKKKGS